MPHKKIQVAHPGGPVLKEKTVEAALLTPVPGD